MEPPSYLLKDQAGHLILLAGQFELFEETGGLADTHAVDFGDVFPLDTKGKGLGLHPCPLARGAKKINTIAREKDAYMHPVAPTLHAPEPTPHPAELLVPVQDHVFLCFF